MEAILPMKSIFIRHCLLLSKSLTYQISTYDTDHVSWIARLFCRMQLPKRERIDHCEINPVSSSQPVLESRYLSLTTVLPPRGTQ